MKLFRLRTLWLVVALLAGTLASSAATNFTLMPVRRVYEGEKFAVTFRLDNGDARDIKTSQINGCRLIYGPSISTSRSYSIVNGHAESSSRIEFTYTYLAEKAGTFTIPEASVVVDGKRYATRPGKVVVEPASNASKPASSRPVDLNDIDTQTSDRTVGSNDVFVRIITSRTRVYEQEAIECTIKLYTKYSISEFFPTKQPSFDGFLIEECDVKPALNAEETFNGQNYLTALLKKCIIFPQKPGKLTINSGNYDITVVQYDNVNMGGFMTVRQPKTRKIQVSSNTASIEVLPLPTPQPQGFTGAVGTFSIDSKLVGNKFMTNDPATLIYTIRGTGNIKYVKEPVIDFPSEFEQYTPKADINAIVSGPSVMGTMTIEYTFVPQTVGSFTIGSDRFVYFDPDKREYVTLTTPAYDIKVVQGAATSASKDQEAIAAKNTDILHIYLGDPHPGHIGKPIVNQGWYYIILALPAIALVVISIANRRNLRRAADVKGQKLARAGRVARKRLVTAKKMLDAHDADKFYAETLRALMGYLSDKFAIPAGKLSRTEISTQLESHGASEQLRASVQSLLDQCEMARYTPDSAGSMATVYDEVSSVINSIESLQKK